MWLPRVFLFLLLVLFVSVVVVGCGFYGITNLNLFFGICTRSSFDYTLGECIGEHPPLGIGGGTDHMAPPRTRLRKLAFTVVPIITIVLNAGHDNLRASKLRLPMRPTFTEKEGAIHIRTDRFLFYHAIMLQIIAATTARIWILHQQQAWWPD